MVELFRKAVACAFDNLIGVIFLYFLRFGITLEKLKGADVLTACDRGSWHCFYKILLICIILAKLLRLSLFHYISGWLCGIHA